MRLKNFEPILDDDRPYWTDFYRDVPDGFRLVNAWDVIDGMYEHLEADKVELIKGFELTYRKSEINGVTYQDFKDLLMERLFSRGAMLDKVLGLMGGALYEPYADKTEKTVGSSKEEMDMTGLSSDVDVPKDNPNDDKDTTRSKTQQGSVADSSSLVEREESAFGFDRPFELVNKFLKDGKTKVEVFNEAMKDCFIELDVMFIW